VLLNKKLTVIVCSKADPSGLNRTLLSLRKLHQDIPEIILVLSGYSNEELDLIESSFSSLNLNLISTPALGIYEAQNVGLYKAQNQFALFLNGGDELISPVGISNLVKEVGDNKWGYGSIKLIKPSTDNSNLYFFKYRKTLHRLGLKYVPHPGTIINVQQGIKLGAFDTKYRSSADHKLLLSFSKISKPTVVKDLISNFYLEGTSTRSQKDIVMDCKKISREEFGFFARNRFIDQLIWDIVLKIRRLLRS
jgi:hypothetical protein